jgi:putative ABC transport system substrate-binding protein
MRRREFIGLVSAAAAWPLTVWAQSTAKVWRIGILDTTTRERNADNLAAFLKALREFGYVEGQNLVIEYRTANGNREQLPGLVSELLTLKVDAIVVRGTLEALAVKQAGPTIPVIMSAVADPVGLGVAASLSHPGGNFTGMSSFGPVLETKRIQLLKEMVPSLKRLAVVGELNSQGSERQWTEIQAAAPSLAIEAKLFMLGSTEDVSRAFMEIAGERFDAIKVGPNSVTRSNHSLIIDLAMKYKLPSIFSDNEFAVSGGLMAYGANYPSLYVRAANILDKVLRGARPADIPVEQPTRFDLVINLRTAKALGIAVPPTLLARADEVIE